MYATVYDGLAEAKIDTILDPPIYMEQKGNFVTSPEAILGQKCDIMINYPSYILFGNEAGCKTSQKKDGNVAG